MDITSFEFIQRAAIKLSFVIFVSSNTRLAYNAYKRANFLPK